MSMKPPPIQEKPSRNEDEFFVKYDAELVKELRSKADAEREKADRAKHFMKCPRCGAGLREVHYQKAIVDVCPDCKGMWLDAEETKIMRHLLETAPDKRTFMNDLADLFTSGRKK